MSVITLVATEDTNIALMFEANVNGKDYYTILKNGFATQDYIEVAEGATPAQVMETYYAK